MMCHLSKKARKRILFNVRCRLRWLGLMEWWQVQPIPSEWVWAARMEMLDSLRHISESQL